MIETCEPTFDINSCSLLSSCRSNQPTQLGKMRVRRTLPSPTVARASRPLDVWTYHQRSSPTVARPLRATGVRTYHGQPSPTVVRPSTATKLLRSHPAAGDGGRRESSTSSATSWYQSPGDSGRCVLVMGLTLKLSRSSGGMLRSPDKVHILTTNLPTNIGSLRSWDNRNQ